MYNLTIILPTFDPIAIDLGIIKIYWYGISYLLGIILGWLYLRYFLIKKPANKDNKFTINISDTVPWIVIGILIGGRIGYVIFYNYNYFIENPIEIIRIWNGGMSFHGGLIGASISLYLFSLRYKKKYLYLMDLIAIAAPIGIFFGRIANFINGELVGKVTNLPWGMVYGNHDYLPRHPSQIYEALMEGVLIFIILGYLSHKTNIIERSGQLSAVFLISYGVFRIIAEFFRQPDEHIGYIIQSPVTLGMLISLPLVLLGIYLWRTNKFYE